MAFFFTADEHYFHEKIIGYCNRPFGSVEEMNDELIRRHNEVVTERDTVFHLGDFCWNKDSDEIRRQLNGLHMFISGSHDKWMMDTYFPQILERRFNEYYIVMCHYAMAVWPRSHYNSWHLYGHSHGRFENVGKSIDVGVDCNNYYPFSFNLIKTIMEGKPDNPNLVKK